MTSWKVQPACRPLEGSLRVPSDKSITHRALMLGGMAQGVTTVINPLLGMDCHATLDAMAAFGASSEVSFDRIETTGSGKLRSPAETIDCGNAGTLIRLLAGAVCGKGVSCVLDGDESLRARPMARVTKPLAMMGADIKASADGTPPIAIEPAGRLKRIEYELPKASAQIKSAVLLAGLAAEGGSCVIEPQPCRDHTERMLPAFGAAVKRKDGAVYVDECPELAPARIEVPADISSAAFFVAAASIVPGSQFVLQEVCVNPTRTGVIAVLRRMGASIELQNERSLGKEPVADLVIRHAPLHGVRIEEADVPSVIDELPVVLAAASVAEGDTELTGAEELRAKESDRLAAMANALQALGVRLQERPDGIKIAGGKLRGGRVDSLGDHRIAMAMAVAALRAEDEVSIADCANVATSFPGFAAMARQVGWQVEELED